MTSSSYFWPGVMLFLTLALIAFEWNVASKKKGGVNIVDKKKIIGMLGIGVAMTLGMFWLQRFF